MPRPDGSILVLAPLPAQALAPLRGRFRLVEAGPDPLGFLASSPDGRGAEIAFTIGNRPFTRAMVELLPALRYVCHFGVGTDLLDLAALEERGVLVTNTPGASASCVADLAVAMLLSLTRALPGGDAFVRRGDWGVRPYGFDGAVGGRRVGIYGMGEIGLKVAARLSAFETEIGYHSRSFRPDAPYRRFPSLRELAGWADDLVVAVAATPRTAGTVDRDVLAALGPGGHVVNVARGSIVDEDALLDALRSGGLRGAGLDTFRNEPAIRDEFRGLDNVILSPHAGGGTARAIARTAEIFHANLRRYLEGQPPRNVVNPETSNP